MNNINQKARELRKNMTPQERKLWNILKNRQFYGYRFRRQFPIGKYVADFVLDQEMKANISGEVEEESVQEPIADFVKIIIHAAKSMIMLERPLKKDKKLQDFVEYIVLDNKINRYVDPDTSLYSINHFVLE